MSRQGKKISLSRVFAAVALVLVVLFSSTPFLTYSGPYNPDLLNIVIPGYISLNLACWGIVGLILCRRGEPLRELSVNLILAPLFFIMFLSTGYKWLRVAPFFIFSLVVFADAYVSIQHAKKLGIAS